MILKSHKTLIRSLHQKKYRDAEGLFIAEGPKLVNELLHSKYKVKDIYATGDFLIPGSKFPTHPITEKELSEISVLTTPNQVLGVFEIPEMKLNVSMLKRELTLALDDIRDPGNLGTIIRIADWFGISSIFCSETSVDVFNPKVIQATMGSIARVNVHYVNLEKILKEFEAVYAAVLHGKNIYTEKLSAKGVILIGNEARGVSDSLMKYVTQKLSIPHFSSPQGSSQAGIDSLNAAIATAIICSEFRRR